MVLYCIIFLVRFTVTKRKPNKILNCNKNMLYKCIYNIIGKTVYVNTLRDVEETALIKKKIS